LEELPELNLTGFEQRDLASLRLEPLGEIATDAAGAGLVEITLLTDSATDALLAPRLDALIGEFDLTSHVRQK
jgi:hypothetical protein